MAAIMVEATRAHAKIVLAGDPQQLYANQAGAAFSAMAERVGCVALTDIRREQAPWQQHATQHLALSEIDKALAAYDSHDHMHAYQSEDSEMATILDQWQDTRSNAPAKNQLMLAYIRDDVRVFNERARDVRCEQGELGADHVMETHQGDRAFVKGDRLYFLRNEKSLGVKNGALGTVESISNKTITMRLDVVNDGPARCVRFHSSDYQHIDHGYAATVHKSQGVTVDRTHVLVSSYFDRHTTYVALSRHREGAELY